MTDKKKEKSFEQNLDRLNELVELLDTDDVTLDEIITYYKEGIELIERCSADLTAAQKSIKELRKRSDGVFELLDTEEN